MTDFVAWRRGIPSWVKWRNISDLLYASSFYVPNYRQTYLGMCRNVHIVFERDSPLRYAWRWIVAVVVSVTAAGWLAGLAAAQFTQDAAASRMATEAQLRASLLESEVARYRLLPTLLANDVDVLRSVDDAPGARETLDAQFAQLADATGAAAIFLLAPNGDTISASNANTPMSFLGQNFAFREYYREARRGGTGIDYARGTVSGRPGLFLSRGTANGGVVVVKLEFDELEAQWGRGGGATMVEGKNGTVLITSDPALRFRTSDAGSEEGDLSALLGGAQIAAAVPIAVEGWKLVHAEPRAVALGGVVPIARLAGALAALAVLALTWIVLARRRRRVDMERARIARTAELESEVEARTRALRLEMDERAASEERAAALREGLRQANRLATLGQVTAGVAHETAQPVAAIRTYAANGVTLSERGDSAGVSENFVAISRLADRIGKITAELRNFSRKRTDKLEDVRLSDAMAGAQLILKERLRPIELDLAPEMETLTVRAGRVQLEQILVNLLQNSAEALVDVPDAKVTISVRKENGMIVLNVADNGPGLSKAMIARLFTPFSTEREGGLGLGLVIARDIARDMGGDLRHVAKGGKGAAFELTLRPAGEVP